jgi:hypothetical protein
LNKAGFCFLQKETRQNNGIRIPIQYYLKLIFVSLLSVTLRIAAPLVPPSSDNDGAVFVFVPVVVFAFVGNDEDTLRGV